MKWNNNKLIFFLPEGTCVARVYLDGSNLHVNFASLQARRVKNDLTICCPILEQEIGFKKTLTFLEG